jgi:hypothetical protein
LGTAGLDVAEALPRLPSAASDDAMSNQRKAARAERRAKRLLEAEGFSVTRSVGSYGLFDLVAVRGETIRFIQVKYGRSFLTRAERHAIAIVTLPNGASKECWHFRRGCTEPHIEVPVTFPRVSLGLSAERRPEHERAAYRAGYAAGWAAHKYREQRGHATESTRAADVSAGAS